MNEIRNPAIDVIEKFMAAKTWVASDSYDGIDARGRELLEEADSVAKQFLASLPADGVWYPSIDDIGERQRCGFICRHELIESIIKKSIDLYRERGGHGGEVVMRQFTERGAESWRTHDLTYHQPWEFFTDPNNRYETRELVVRGSGQ